MAPQIQNVAIFGSSGRVGSHFIEELLKTGKHNITALVRAESSGNLPEGVKKISVAVDDEQSIISALKDQQFFIITLSVRAPPDTHGKLVQAAVKAGVPYIMPNAYGGDVAAESFRQDELYGKDVAKKIDEITDLGGSYVAMCCGFWYEWSLSIGEQWFGFDIKNRKVVFYDDGNTVITTSTWKQCGRALAAFLSLPESGSSPAVADWKNGCLYFCSFKVSQRDMLDSLHRVLGTTDNDWQISYEPSGQRETDGLKELKSGNFLGFAKAMYAKGMKPGGTANFEHRGLQNDTLGLPKEDLDEATKRTVEMVESGYNPLGL